MPKPQLEGLTVNLLLVQVQARADDGSSVVAAPDEIPERFSAERGGIR